MSSPPASENMAPPSTSGRGRRNSNDSQLSQLSKASKESWLKLIHPTLRHAGNPMEHFINEGGQRLDSLVMPNGPPELRSSHPPSSSYSDLSIAEAEYGSSTIYRSDSTRRHEGSICTSYSMPTLDSSSLTALSSPTPSTFYNDQMYELQEDSSGLLYTLQPIGSPIRTERRPDGTHPCLFFFNRCYEAFDKEETWVPHVDSHFASQGIQPPSVCKCTICGKSFAEDEHLPANWQKFLKHAFDEHYVKGGLKKEISPDPDFIKHCRDQNMISVFTCTRLESQQPASSEDDQTPRSRRHLQSGADIAQVLYPSNWDQLEAQPRTVARTIEVHRRGRARGGRS
ncbi:hypothetical protein L873DRAFT_1839927 [Choiromyces venosus 120613-1]|uniref:C2H2-type domain-containing protein n=1 Tax=Choiromyces venosus 120613-1 TaxID=1336337 RepID=A0A3N4KHN9_9PEZI|nr:hypothetical protein L873DRAFT_1839927 [Choiromyces venosus 120613-1]